MIEWTDELMCIDCLCRVCARNKASDNYSPGVEHDCFGCNCCTGVIAMPEDCTCFIPDDDCEGDGGCQ